MGTPGRAGLGVALLVAASCTGSPEPQMMITGVMPMAAFSDARIDLVIHGGPFRPIYDIDTNQGRETAELGAFNALLAPTLGAGPAFPTDAPMWLSSSALAATLPEGIGAGTYDIQVRDPRGAFAILPNAFVSLGRDQAPPVITIEQPLQGTIVNPGAQVPVAYEVDDGLGFLMASSSWQVSTGDVSIPGSCPIEQKSHRITCRFLFDVPQATQNGQPLAIVVTAADTAGNAQRAETTLAVGLPAVVKSFTPAEGSALGGTLVSVHGANFISGTQVLLGGVPLDPGGGVVKSDALIQGTAPAHDPGAVTLTVRTGASSVAGGTYTFVGRPSVRAIAPTSGPSAGCTRVAIVGENFRGATSVWFGADDSSGSPLLCPQHVSPNRIEGYVPPGMGAVSIFVGDPVSGVGELPLAFTYLDVDAPNEDAGAPPATCACDGGAP